VATDQGPAICHVEIDTTSGAYCCMDHQEFAKTTFARAPAGGAVGVAFLSLNPAQVYASSYVIDGEATIRRALPWHGSVSPCILFLDVIDAIFDGGDSGRGSSAKARVLSIFWNRNGRCQCYCVCVGVR
jgi:hypothetical protein